MPEAHWYSPNFFGFLKHRLPFILLSDIKEVRVQLFVIVIDLEEGASVRIHQVFCIYLEHKRSQRSHLLHFLFDSIKCPPKVQRYD